MKARSLLIKGIVISILWVFLFSNTEVGAFQKKQAITIKEEGLILNYSEQIYWSEGQFNQEYEKYSKNKAKYLKDLVENFSNMFLESNLKANNWSVSFESRYSLKTKEAIYLTFLECKIDGANSGTAENFYFRTEWLLIPLLENEIDLYNFKKIADKMLVYEGRVNRIPIKITFEFSKPISHCHYHIWPK